MLRQGNGGTELDVGGSGGGGDALPVGVFWDIENQPVPRGVDGESIAEALRDTVSAHIRKRPPRVVEMIHSILI